MRKETFGVGDVVHVFNRGNRKQEIVRDDIDRWRFLQTLFYFNDEFSPENPFRTLNELLGPDFNSGRVLIWPSLWPERNKLVDILAVTLMDNHYHLVLQEIKEGGIARFMHKFGTGTTNRFNTRHKETGRLFQGPYKARRVGSDNYLKYLNVYLHIKNVFELYPGGMKKALNEFEDAYKFATHYPYTSLGGYIHNESNMREIISSDLLDDEFANEHEFKEFARTCAEQIFFEEASCGLQFPAIC